MDSWHKKLKNPCSGDHYLKDCFILSLLRALLWWMQLYSITNIQVINIRLTNSGSQLSQSPFLIYFVSSTDSNDDTIFFRSRWAIARVLVCHFSCGSVVYRCHFHHLIILLPHIWNVFINTLSPELEKVRGKKGIHFRNILYSFHSMAQKAHCGQKDCGCSLHLRWLLFG